MDMMKQFAHKLESPGTGGINIVPANQDLDRSVRQIRASGAGNIKITGVDGSTWIAAFLAGESRPIHAVRVWSTDTTATGIEGLF